MNDENLLRDAKIPCKEIAMGVRMTNHRNHNVLAWYCWDCKRPTSNRVPGWKKNSGDNGLIKELSPWTIKTTSVIWADGSAERNNECQDCGSHDCKHPVHLKEEKYREIITKKSYWDDIKNNSDGEAKEHFRSNPDRLEFIKAHRTPATWEYLS